MAEDNPLGDINRATLSFFDMDGMAGINSLDNVAPERLAMGR